MSPLSLKSLIPHLVKEVGMTPAALYERQRALVRAGLIHSERGRGPGSGVRATPESVGLLLIALLATGSLAETEGHTKALANLKSTTKRCPLTGKKTFASAVSAVLASEDLAKRVRWIEVERGGAMASAAIIFEKTQEERLSEAEAGKRFEARMPRTSQFGVEHVGLTLGIGVRARLALRFRAIARYLKEAKK